MIIHCGQCAYYTAQRQGCLLLQIKCDPEVDFCSHATYEGKFCEFCGKILSKGGLLQQGKDENFHLICGNCASQIGICATCEKATSCAFDNYSGDKPKLVTQQVRQGNMVMQTQVRNPEIIRETCQKGCECYDEKIGCKKQNGGQCEKYTSNF